MFDWDLRAIEFGLADEGLGFGEYEGDAFDFERFGYQPEEGVYIFGFNHIE